MDNCENCKYFSNGERMGICRRYPNFVNKNNLDYCGEYSSNSKNLSINLMVQSMTEPVLINIPKRKAGRPKKYA